MAGILELKQLEKESDNFSEEQVKNFETESYRFIKFLLENEKNMPENLVALFWPFFDKEMALSNFSDRDVALLMDDLRISILNLKMSIPDFKKTYNDIIHLDNLKPKFFAKIKRSTGGMNRERALEATQIRQFLTNETEQVRGGILSRLAGIFGGRK